MPDAPAPRRFASVAKRRLRSAVLALGVPALALLLGACGAGAGNGSPGASATGGEEAHVVLSTDVSTGLVGGWRAGRSDVDDGLAMAMAAAAPELDLRGVIVTLGNNDLAPQMLVAERIAEGLGQHRSLAGGIPVHPGAAVALTDPQVAWPDGTEIPEACWNEGVAFLHERIEAAGAGAVTVLALGPLTDVACLVLNEPETASRIGRVVAIMGRAPEESFALGGVRGLTDFNYVMDPRAARVVLESDIPLTFLPFSLTSSALVPADSLDFLRRSPGELNDYLLGAVEPWVAYWRDAFGEDGFHPWDQNAVYYAMQPGAFACQPAGYEIVDCALDPDDPDAPSACAGHGPEQPGSLDKETSQLWLSPEIQPARATYCDRYASDAARDAFLTAVWDFAR